MSHTHVIAAYGHFMVAWSVLETTIEAAIMKQLQIDAQRAAILTTSMQFKQRINVLCALLEISEKDYSIAIKTLKGVEKSSKRNMLVHGHIIVGVPTELTFVKSNIVDGYNANRAKFNALDLLMHTKRINEKTMELQKLLDVDDNDMQMLANIGLNASKK